MFAPLAEAFERGRGQSVDNRPPRFSPPPSISSALSSNGPFLSQLTRPTYHVFPIAPHTFPSKGLEQYSHCHCIVHNPEEGGVRYHVFTHSSPVSHPLRLPPWQLQFNGDKPAPTDSQSISSLFHLFYQNHHFQCVSYVSYVNYKGRNQVRIVLLSKFVFLLMNIMLIMMRPG